MKKRNAGGAQHNPPVVSGVSSTAVSSVGMDDPYMVVRIAAALMGTWLLWTPVLILHLTPALFAALATYGGTLAIGGVISRRWPSFKQVRFLALALLLAIVGGAAAVAVERTAEAAAAGGGYVGLLRQMATALEQLRALLPSWLAAHLPSSLEAIRAASTAWLRAHALQVQLWGGHTVRGLGYVLAGVVIGALLALAPARPTTSDDDAPLAVMLRREFERLNASFSAVVFAQVRIASINTLLTAVYLLGVLPMAGQSLPFGGTLLIVTFVTGLIPIVGNLVSNVMIVLIGLTHSVVLAGLSLLWLVGIHKLEYFLNAHFVGRRIRARAWELLSAMLLFEALFGVAGLMSAPVLYAQAKNTLHERGWL